MKITAVQTHHLKYRMPRPIGCSTLLYGERDILLVKISTDEGLVGWGETFPFPGVRATIAEGLAPKLIGQDPMQHRRLWRQLWGPNFGNGMAVGAVDIALHDLRGKALGLPIAELLGGRLRDRVPVYASGLSYIEGIDAEKQYPETAIELVGRGFKALKIRIGRFEPRRDLAAVRAVREAVGPDIKLMADGNGAYTLSTAIRVGRELDRYGLYWFEEPIPQPQYAGYETLHEKLDIALAGGEALNSRGVAKELLCRQVFDIIQPDISLCGGIGECLFIAEMARLWGTLCYPHCYSGAIVTTATLHVLSLLPDASWGHTTETPMLELDVTGHPFVDRLVSAPLEIGQDGCMAVPRGPGLGIEVDERAIKQYEV
jgi:D-galactarolactone cycloisomerase